MVSRSIDLFGHLIDSHILSNAMDVILDGKGDFEVENLQIGKVRQEPSFARITVTAPDEAALETILSQLHDMGASVVEHDEVVVREAREDGVVPDGFYVTTNLETHVRVRAEWIPVLPVEMDCAISVEPDNRRAAAKPLHQVKAGDLIVCGRKGIKVVPVERSRLSGTLESFRTPVPPDRPKDKLISEIAGELLKINESGGKILVVAGPVVIDSGAGRYLESLIGMGLVQLLFAGNGFAAHDIELSLFGTAAGVLLERGVPLEYGHENYIRAINTVRKAGSIAGAVEAGTLTSGVMHACVMHRVDFVLAGSVRDDGPLPDTITDSLEAQGAMRRKVQGVKTALMLGTTLHSIAVANLLPASVRIVSVDVNPGTVEKLQARSPYLNLGFVADVDGFLRSLCRFLEEKGSLR